MPLTYDHTIRKEVGLVITIAVEDVASAVTILTGVTGGGWWIYTRGKAAGRRDTLLEERLARLEREEENRPPPDRPRRWRKR